MTEQPVIRIVLDAPGLTIGESVLAFSIGLAIAVGLFLLWDRFHK